MVDYYEFNIYPMRLAVVVGKNPSELISECKNSFYDENGEKKLDIRGIDRNVRGFELILRDESGVDVIVICIVNYATVGTMAHEALHALFDISNWIGANAKNTEWSNYLVAYIANCVHESIKKYNDNENSN
jgi:hypothetical protein